MPANHMLASMLTQEFQDMFQRWGANQPPRLGLRASQLLAYDDAWCVREGVLRTITPAEEWIPEDLSWRTNAVFLHGWRIHQKWQSLFDHAGLVVYNDQLNAMELDLTHHDEEANVFFSPDAIIEYAGTRYVVEIKGITTTDFQKLKDCTIEQAMHLNKSIRGAVPQCHLYMHLTGIQHGIILAEDKNTQEFRIWLVDYDIEVARPYLQRSIQVKGALVVYNGNGHGKLPKRICESATDARAKRCPLRAVCFKSDNDAHSEQEESDVSYEG